MARFQALYIGMLVALLVPSAVWSQEAPPAADPVPDALATVRSVGSASAGDINAVSRLAEARRILTEQRKQSLPQVAALLDSKDGLVRLNAAMILSGIAKSDTSPMVILALQKALKDADTGVAYWGFQGLMSDGVAEADMRAAMREVLGLQRPRALRLAAVSFIGEKKLKAAQPVLVDHLQALMKDYKAAVETLVSMAGTTRPPAPKPTPPPGTPASMAPPPPLTSAPPGPGPAGRPPLEARTPGLAPSPEPGRPELPTAAPGEGGPVPARNVDSMKIEEVTALVQSVEALPAVVEFHQTGLVLEEIIASLAPTPEQTVKFGFTSTAPWELGQCAEKAVAWRNEHRAEFDGVPTVHLVAPPATRPAPAVTTAPAPATTTQAPAPTTP